MITSTGAILKIPAVRVQATVSGNGTSPPDSHNPPPPPPPAPAPAPPPPPAPAPPRRPLLSVPKPSWIVRTESNVRLEKREKPEPSCVVCRGSGRVDCYDCCGKGRTNDVELAMLPNGKWPKWCTTCGGSGLAYCSRCLGTGEYRYLMGFHFMKKDQASDQGSYKVRDVLRTRRSPADSFLNDEIP